MESEVETARISPRSVLKASKLQIKFECPVCCVRVKSHSHHQMERAKGATRGPELVTGLDNAKESSKDAIAMDLSTTYASTYGMSRDIT